MGSIGSSDQVITFLLLWGLFTTGMFFGTLAALHTVIAEVLNEVYGRTVLPIVGRHGA